MMNLHQRSVNVSRVELLKKLKENLTAHRAEYDEAVIAFHARLQDDLKLALKKVKAVQDVESLKNFKFHVPFPQNHSADYEEVIEMLEMSVDKSINLDAQSFRAYIKNEWVWRTQFESAKLQYVTAGSGLSL